MKPSEFLSTLDPWTVYPVSALEDLDEEYREYVPTLEYDQVRRMMQDDPRGGTLKPDRGVRMFVGWIAASTLTGHCIGTTSQKLGRGSAFRENVELLLTNGL